MSTFQRSSGTIALVAAGFGACASPVFECEPHPRWTTTTTQVETSRADFGLLLGIADESTFLLHDSEPGQDWVETFSGRHRRSVWGPAADVATRGAVVIGGHGRWVTIDRFGLSKGTSDAHVAPTVASSPLANRYLHDDEIANDPTPWAAMSEHTFRAQRDVLLFDADFSHYKIVPIGARIVRGTTSQDERVTCVTAEYAPPYPSKPGRYGVHCFAWASIPPPPRSETSRQGELFERDAVAFDKPITVVPMSLSDLRFVSARRLEFVPLSEFQSDEVPLDVTATRCGFWASTENSLFYSSGERFNQVPLTHEPVTWQVRNLVVGPQSAASLTDGILTQLTPHEVD